MQRYFVTLTKKPSFYLSRDDSYHILTVMRMTIGDKIEVVSARKLYLCEIIDVKNNQVEVKIIEEIKEDKELGVEITIAQALVKESKMDFILQKTVELGVTSIVPYQAKRSVVKVNGKENKKLERWQRIVKEASEQSKRAFIPQVLPILDIDKLCKADYQVKILCTVNEVSKNIKEVLQNYHNSDKIIIVIGPEGGFEPSEEKKLIDAGFISTSLGGLVLRTETAGLYVMSILNYYFMR